MSGVEVRLRRASTPDGTGEYQELRWRDFTGLPNSNANWSWDFDSGAIVAEMERVNVPAGLSGASLGTGRDDVRDHETAGNDADRVFTWDWDGHNWQRGFAYGGEVTNGANNANSFLWEDGDENHAIPYTEVYLRSRGTQGPGGDAENSLVKRGSGALTLAPTSVATYHGQTHVEDGMLDVDGVIQDYLDAGAVVVENGTTLTGGGNIQRAVEGQAGSLIQPDGNIVLGDGSAAGVSTDGTLIVNSGLNVTLVDSNQAELGVSTQVEGTLTAANGVGLSLNDVLSGNGTVLADVSTFPLLPATSLIVITDNDPLPPGVQVNNDAATWYAAVNFSNVPGSATNNGVSFTNQVPFENAATGTYDGTENGLNYSLSGTGSFGVKSQTPVPGQGIVVTTETTSGDTAPTTPSVATDLLQTSLASVNPVGGDGYLTGPAKYNGTTGTAQENSGTNPANVNGSGTYDFQFDLTTSPLGYDISEVNVYTGWGDFRAGQDHRVFYSLVGDASFILFADIAVGHDNGTLRTSITDSGGLIASGVDAIRFIVDQSEFVYREVDVIGTPTGEAEDPLFFTEAAFSDLAGPMTLTVANLNGESSYIVEILHGDGRTSPEGDGQYDLQLLGATTGTVVTVDNFTFGTGPGDSPDGAEAKKTVSFMLTGETGFTYAITPEATVEIPLTGWDFWDGSGTLAGWTVLNGGAHFRPGDGDGMTPANAGGGFAHDGDHDTLLVESPEFKFNGTTLDGTNAMIWGSGGGAGDQDGGGPAFSTPAQVLAFNGGNSNGNGEKGLAFYNVSTGVYDTVLFNQGEGGTDTYSLTAAALIAAGVDLSATYRLHYYENDEGGWGWGQLNFVNVAANEIVANDRPASIAGFQVRELPPQPGGGIVSPGETGGNGTTGVLTTQNIFFDADAQFTVDLAGPDTGVTPGTDYDQLSVHGTIDLGGSPGAVLHTTYNLVGSGPYVIVNNDGTDPVVGLFSSPFSGLPLAEGDTVSVSGRPFEISYKYDASDNTFGDGNDVALFINPDPVFPVEGEILVRLDPSNPAVLQVFVDNADNRLDFAVGDFDPSGLPLLVNSPLGALRTLTLTGGASSDSLAVDVQYGLIRVPIAFTGGGGTDTLILRGDVPGTDPAREVFHAAPATGDESLTIDPDGTFNGNEQVLTLTGVSRVIDTVPVFAARLSGTTGADSMAVALGANAGTPLAGNFLTTQLTSDTFATFEAANKATTFLDGLAGYDTLDLSATGPQTLTLVGPGTIDGYQGDEFDNIDSFVGAAGSELVGPNLDTTWNVTSNNAGSVVAGGRSADFSGFGDLTGGTANDTFVLSNGSGLSGAVDGGLGIDTLDYSAFTTDVTVSLAAGSAEHIGSLAAGGVGDVGSSIENVYGGSANDTLTGDADANVLRDGLGSDVLSGGEGDDRFQLQPGGGSHDFLLDAGTSGGDWIDFSQSGIGPGPGVTIDLDLLGWDADGLVDVTDVAGSVDQDVPQNVYQGNLVSLLGMGPAQAPPADSPFDNILGSAGDDTLLVDPTDNIRYVDGGGGSDTPLSFDAGNSVTIDTGRSITALGIGSVVYNNIPLDPFHTGPRIIDDGDVGFTADPVFGRSPSEGYRGDERYAAPGDGRQHATWTFDGVTPGWYSVAVTWVPGANRARDAQYSVLDGSTPAFSTNDPANLTPADVAEIKQRVAPIGFRDAGTAWQNLSDDQQQLLYFQVTSHTLVVRLSNQADSFVMADAVRIERLVSQQAEIRVLEGDALQDVTSGRWLTNLGTTSTSGSAVQTYTIQNIGLAPLTVAVDATGLPAAYTVAPTALTIPPGQAETITLTLRSTTPGTFAGTLRLDTNDRDEDPFEIRVTGLVRAAVPVASANVVVVEDEPDPTGQTEFQVEGGFRYIRRDTRYLDNDYYYARQSGSIASWTVNGLTAGQALPGGRHLGGWRVRGLERAVPDLRRRGTAGRPEPEPDGRVQRLRGPGGHVGGAGRGRAAGGCHVADRRTVRRCERHRAGRRDPRGPVPAGRDPSVRPAELGRVRGAGRRSQRGPVRLLRTVPHQPHREDLRRDERGRRDADAERTDLAAARLHAQPFVHPHHAAAGRNDHVRRVARRGGAGSGRRRRFVQQRRPGRRPLRVLGHGQHRGAGRR